MTFTVHVPRIDVHIHIDRDAVQGQIEVLTQLVNKRTQEIMMAISQTEANLIAAFDAETTRIADKIQQLMNNPPADDAEFNAALQAQIDRLKGVGANGQPPNPNPEP